MRRRIYTLLVLSGLLFVYSCSKDDESEPATSTGTSSNPERDAALSDYTTNYIGSAVSSTGWTGSTATCTAGSVSQATKNAVIQRINYFRRMVGLNDQCVLDTTLYAQEQETALIMSANHALNHNPPNTWTCWTQTAANGAGASNLALGSNSSASVTAFINDFGTGNEVAGHRRWILHSRKQKFSFGSTNDAMALYVFLNDTNTVVPEYIAYPPKGYVPQTLVFGRWSFGIPNASFASATVSMTGPSGNVPLTIVSSTDNGYGDNTLVWEPTGIDVSNTADVAYTVTVSGITGAAASSYTYTVKIFKP
ncbi:MAG: CAP domain-containing protein [Bacteroidia bacterium]